MLNSKNPLHEAAAEGNLQVTEQWITQGLDVNAKHTDSGTYPIYIAAKKGHLKIVNYLLDECQATIDESFLFWVIKSPSNRQALLKTYINSTFFKKTLSDEGQLYSYIAAIEGNIEPFKNDIQKLTITNSLGITPVYFAHLACQLDKFQDFVSDWQDYPPISEVNGEKSNEKTREYWLSLSKYQNHLGCCYDEKNEYEEASFHFQAATKALNQITDKTPQDWRSLAFSQNSLGYCYFRQNMYAEAIPCYEEVIKAKNNITDKMPQDWRQLAFSQNSLGYCYFRQNMYAEAIPCYKAAIDALENITDKTPQDLRALAIGQNKLGYCYSTQEQENYTAAAKELRNASRLTLLSNQKTADNNLIKRNVQLLAKIYRNLQTPFQLIDTLKSDLCFFAQALFSAGPMNGIWNGMVAYQVNANYCRYVFRSLLFRIQSQPDLSLKADCIQIIEHILFLKKENLLPNQDFSSWLDENDNGQRFTAELENLKSQTQTLCALIEDGSSINLALIHKVSALENQLKQLQSELAHTQKALKSQQQSQTSYIHDSKQPVITKFFEVKKPSLGKRAHEDTYDSNKRACTETNNVKIPTHNLAAKPSAGALRK